MIEHELDASQSILYLRPKSALAAEDFAEVAQLVDPHIEETGGLAGIIIEVSSFPGWQDFRAFVAHVRFVQDHHRQVKKVALVTDSPFGDIAEHLASHFVSAEIKHFRAADVEAAREWILATS